MWALGNGAATKGVVSPSRSSRFSRQPAPGDKDGIARVVRAKRHSDPSDSPHEEARSPKTKRALA